ncbi:Uncharacterised protein [Candidatus Gugararchaeum adminiculabundum]|nr:Uncharacterised protein [Candidatus Gugararchaeum adminiculabundum]
MGVSTEVEGKEGGEKKKKPVEIPLEDVRPFVQPIFDRLNGFWNKKIKKEKNQRLKQPPVNWTPEPRKTDNVKAELAWDALLEKQYQIVEVTNKLEKEKREEKGEEYYPFKFGGPNVLNLFYDGKILSYGATGNVTAVELYDSMGYRKQSRFAARSAILDRSEALAYTAQPDSVAFLGMNTNVVFVAVKKDFFLYHAETNKWEKVEFPKGADPKKALLEQDGIRVPADFGDYYYDAKKNAWEMQKPAEK